MSSLNKLESKIPQSSRIGQLAIEQSYYVDAPRERVFQALTEPKMLVKWFLTSAYVDPREGGDYDFDWLNGYHYSGRIMRFEKNETVSYSWGRETRATFELTRKGRGTLLKLHHDGFADPEPLGMAASNWGYFLTNLKSVLKNGTDLRSKHDLLGISALRE
jgi:uncharacterized protein YndB with AHSA1/START domain